MSTKTLAIDNGSYETRAGLCGNTKPSTIIKNIIKLENGINNNKNLLIQSPMNHGNITNFDEMERLWGDIYSKLQISPENHSTILTEHSLPTNYEREKITEIMFEIFDIPSLYLIKQTATALFATSDNLNGFVINIGYDTTRIVQYVNGYSFPNTINQFNIGGQTITNNLQKLLLKNNDLNINQNNTNKIKHESCFVAFNYEMAMGKIPKYITNGYAKSIGVNIPDCIENVCYKYLEKDHNRYKKIFKLPDNNTINLTNERFTCCESLFGLNKYEFGIHEGIVDNFSKIKTENNKKILLNNIVLCGATCELDGIYSRLKHEIMISLNKKYRNYVNILKPKFKQSLLPWIGCSILGECQQVINKHFITKQMYNEYGSNIAHKMSF